MSYLMKIISGKSKTTSTILSIALSWPIGLLIGITFLFGGMCCRAWQASDPDSAVRLERARSMLKALGDDLHEARAAERMQELFPEGDVYTLTLYSCGLVNVCLACPQDQSYRKMARSEILWVLDRLQEPAVVRKFPDTEVANGVYFLSHRTQLIAGLHLIDTAPSLMLTREYHDNCQRLAQAILDSPWGLLQSYPGGCWPADNILALRCLALHDMQFHTDYSVAIEKTLGWVRANLDIDTGTIPHRVSAATGAVITPTRGCTMVLSLQYLIDVDIDLFNQQYRRMREHFLGDVLGITPWREYPKGRNGCGDVDSGPIIFGGGASATGVGAGTALLAGDISSYGKQMAIVEAFAFPSRRAGGRRYWNGILPVADGFAVCSFSAISWRGAKPDAALATQPVRPWALIGVLSAIYFLIGFFLVMPAITAIRSQRSAASATHPMWRIVEISIKVLLLCLLIWSTILFIPIWCVVWGLCAVVRRFLLNKPGAASDED